jgi:hypothetical protein
MRARPLLAIMDSLRARAVKCKCDKEEIGSNSAFVHIVEKDGVRDVTGGMVKEVENME